MTQLIKMEMNNGETKEVPAYKVLLDINNCESIPSLIGMKWNGTGKKDFLMGKVSATIAIVAEPLTDSEADQAIQEYNSILNKK